ncbi:MAG: gamma-glutamyl-gamma-aminobutyrate hydrolase family protein [Anaerolineaceae bacterium]
MTAPVIGVTMSHSVNKYGLKTQVIVEEYLEALRNAGCIPLLIPNGITAEQTQEALIRVDGLLFTGGGDIDPQVFDGAEHPAVYDIYPPRDTLEISLVRAAVDEGIPFLAICRGAQVVNVALGGTLYTHIDDQLSDSLDHHGTASRERSQPIHNIHIQPDSRLREVLGVTELMVNSLHHQGIQRVGDGLRVVATAPDSLIEALEVPDHPFEIAVQWHPEWMQQDAPQRALFQALAAACE